MKQANKNPWIWAGAIAGISVAAGLALVWPSPARVNEKAIAVRKPPEQPEQKDACRACQEARCELTLNACYPPKDGRKLTWPPPEAGGPPSPEEQADCRETYECFRRTQCANVDPGICYCGEGVDSDACFAGKASPKGPCKEIIEKSARTTDARAIGLGYSDPSHPLGLGSMLRQCDLAFCKSACSK